MAYKAKKWLMLNGNMYRTGHVFPVGAAEHNSIRQEDIDEGRVEEISDSDAETQAKSRATFQPKKRGRGNPSEL